MEDLIELMADDQPGFLSRSDFDTLVAGGGGRSVAAPL
jgi:hypothetical protein